MNNTASSVVAFSREVAGGARSAAEPASRAVRLPRSDHSALRPKQGSTGRIKAVESGVSRQALRLLSALAAAGAYAVDDPTQDGMVLVRADRQGVSVGAGVFPAACAEELVRHDLAWRAATPSGRAALRMSEAGRAHLRRRNADARDESAYLAQHRDLVEVDVQLEDERARVRKNDAESPLDWLKKRKDRQGEALVDEASYLAGERLRRDLTLAGVLPGVTARWDGLAVDRGQSGAGRDPAGATDRAVAARQRARKALTVVGPDFADLLVDLCGFLKGLEAIEQERGWPARSAKVVVKLALARLADHYGFERAAHGPAASRGVRAWRAVVLDGGRAP